MYKNITKIICIICFVLMLSACANSNINSDITKEKIENAEIKENTAAPKDMPIKVKSIACGNDFSLLLDKEGYVWSCGRNE